MCECLSGRLDICVFVQKLVLFTQMFLYFWSSNLHVVAKINLWDKGCDLLIILDALSAQLTEAAEMLRKLHVISHLFAHVTVLGQ